MWRKLKNLSNADFNRLDLLATKGQLSVLFGRSSWLATASVLIYRPIPWYIRSLLYVTEFMSPIGPLFWSAFNMKFTSSWTWQILSDSPCMVLATKRKNSLFSPLREFPNHLVSFRSALEVQWGDLFSRYTLNYHLICLKFELFTLHFLF